MTVPIVMAIRTVETAAIDGSNCHSRYVRIRMGSVMVFDPTRKSDTVTLSNDVTNANRNPATMPGGI